MAVVGYMVGTPRSSPEACIENVYIAMDVVVIINYEWRLLLSKRYTIIKWT